LELRVVLAARGRRARAPPRAACLATACTWACARPTAAARRCMCLRPHCPPPPPQRTLCGRSSLTCVGQATA